MLMLDTDKALLIQRGQAAVGEQVARAVEAYHDPDVLRTILVKLAVGEVGAELYSTLPEVLGSPASLVHAGVHHLVQHTVARLHTDAWDRDRKYVEVLLEPGVDEGYVRTDLIFGPHYFFSRKSALDTNVWYSFSIW